jgi:hypothetical protein
MANASPKRDVVQASSHTAEGCSNDMQVAIVVEAEEEGGECYRWEGRCPLAAPLATIAHAWALKHSVPVRAVAFEEESGTEVDQSRTPADYGWTKDKRVRLKCYPASDDFAGSEGHDASSEPQQPPAVQAKNTDAVASQPRVTKPAAKNATVGFSTAVEAKGIKRASTKDATPEIEIQRKAAEASPQASKAAPKRAAKSSAGRRSNVSPPPGDFELIDSLS